MKYKVKTRDLIISRLFIIVECLSESGDIFSSKDISIFKQAHRELSFGFIEKDTMKKLVETEACDLKYPDLYLLIFGYTTYLTKEHTLSPVNSVNDCLYNSFVMKLWQHTERPFYYA